VEGSAPHYTSCRRSLTLLSVEHLGLLPPQNCYRGEPVTEFMRPAPAPIAYKLGDEADLRVADPLADETQSLWNETARVNREVFTELFHPAPTNLVRDWNGYAVSLGSCLQIGRSLTSSAAHRAMSPRSRLAMSRLGSRSTSSRTACRACADRSSRCRWYVAPFMAVNQPMLILILGLPHRPERLREQHGVQWVRPDTAGVHLGAVRVHSHVRLSRRR
jgi:hypothetical protein